MLESYALPAEPAWSRCELLFILSYHYFVLIVPVSDIPERVCKVPSPFILIGLQGGREIVQVGKVGTGKKPAVPRGRAGSCRSGGLALNAGGFRTAMHRAGSPLEARGTLPARETTAPGLPRAAATDYKSQAAPRRRAPGAILVGGAD